MPRPVVPAGLLKAARSYVVFFGAAGFLFGQVFNGYFSFAGTLAGVSGILAAVLGGPRAPRSAGLDHLVVPCCLAGCIGVALDAYHYYTVLDSPGNYYAWFLTGPYVGALLLIGYHARP